MAYVTLLGNFVSILYKSPYYNILLQSILMMSSLDQFMCVTSTIQNP